MTFFLGRFRSVGFLKSAARHFARIVGQWLLSVSAEPPRPASPADFAAAFLREMERQKLAHAHYGMRSMRAEVPRC